MDANDAGGSSINKSTLNDDYDNYGGMPGLSDYHGQHLLNAASRDPTDYQGPNAQSSSERSKVKSSFLGNAGNAVKASFSRIRGGN